MIPLSLLLVVASLGLLVAGLVDGSQLLVVASLVASAGAVGCLLASVLHRRRVLMIDPSGIRTPTGEYAPLRQGGPLPSAGFPAQGGPPPPAGVPPLGARPGGLPPRGTPPPAPAPISPAGGTPAAVPPGSGTPPAGTPGTGSSPAGPSPTEASPTGTSLTGASPAGTAGTGTSRAGGPAAVPPGVGAVPATGGLSEPASAAWAEPAAARPAVAPDEVDAPLAPPATPVAAVRPAGRTPTAEPSPTGSERDRAEQAGAKQAEFERDRAERDGAERDRAERDRAERDRAERDRAERDRAGEAGSARVGSGQDGSAGASHPAPAGAVSGGGGAVREDRPPAGNEPGYGTDQSVATGDRPEERASAWFGAPAPAEPVPADQSDEPSGVPSGTPPVQRTAPETGGTPARWTPAGGQTAEPAGEAAPLGLADEPGVEDIPISDALRVAQFSDEVLVVDGRPRYHLTGCPRLTDRTTVPLPVSAARRAGFTPCAVCRPDATLLARSRSASGRRPR